MDNFNSVMFWKILLLKHVDPAGQLDWYSVLDIEPSSFETWHILSLDKIILNLDLNAVKVYFVL